MSSDRGQATNKILTKRSPKVDKQKLPTFPKNVWLFKDKLAWKGP